MAAKPNAAHDFIAELQNKFDVQVVTQNVDDLHERAGSKNIIHLHGELMKARSTVDPSLIYQLTKEELKVGDNCVKGSQLRPHIVWFGEDVPQMEIANSIAEKADFFVVIGTSLNVYPAAGIINFVKASTPKWLVDPGDFNLDYIKDLKHIKQTAVNGVKSLREDLFKNL